MLCPHKNPWLEEVKLSLHKVTLGLGEALGTTSLREVTAFAVADSLGSRADTVLGAVGIVRDETILAGEVAWLVAVANGLAVVGVVALLLAGLAVDQIREELVSRVVAQQVRNSDTNWVAFGEVREDGQAQAEVNMAGDERLVVREDVKEFDIKVKSDANVNKTSLYLGLAGVENRVTTAASCERNGRQKEWDDS